MHTSYHSHLKNEKKAVTNVFVQIIRASHFGPDYVKNILNFLFLFFFFFFWLFRAALWHTEVPRLGGESELLLPAYATATATWDLRRSCDLHHSSRL